MSAATALKLLQQFAAEKKEITEDDSNIIFGDQGTFPKTLPTGFKTMTKTEGYQLHALVFFHKQHAANQDLAGDTPEAKRKFMNHYLNRCAKENVAAVQFSDYDVVVNFIAGKDVKGRTGAAGTNCAHRLVATSLSSPNFPKPDDIYFLFRYDANFFHYVCPPGQSLLGIETDDINALKALQDRLEDETSVVDFVAMKNETTLSSRLNTVSVTGIDFSEHYQQINDKVHKAWMEILKRKASKDKVKHGTPIIVVPSAPASTITLWNVKSFLDSCLYVPSMEIKKKHKGLAPKSVEISHTFSDGKVLKFQVRINSAFQATVARRRAHCIAN